MKWGLAQIGALMLLATGCGQAIHSQVSSFHQLPREEQEHTYAFIPLKEQRKDFDFMLYEERVRAHLNARGFVPAQFEKAEYIVALAYESDRGEDTFATYPIIGQGGSSSFRLSGTTHAYTNTLYSSLVEREPARDAAAEGDPATSVLRLDIVRRDSIGHGRLEKVYEGEVLSSDGHKLSSIVPAMIEALFQDFPGNDGEVRQVTARSVPPIESITASNTRH
ncbi:MAG TPA: DUF4136 domain-containing protein [Polyangiaceae bacterium]|nr:DUF4136 domain-containing protein [Polyangiaceae bacterium]